MQTIIIGGGISGLACAYRLRQMKIPALLLEQAERVGGLIASVERDGFLFELGPQSFAASDLLLKLIESLGLGPRLLRADPRAPRFVLVGGRLRRVPMTPPALLASSLLSPRSKGRLIGEMFRRTQPPVADESVADFVRRKFGTELLERLVGPFVSGVYAGDPEKLSLRSAFPPVYHWEKEAGSVLRGAMKSRKQSQARPTLCSFRDGVATLVRTLDETLGEQVWRGVSAQAILRARGDTGSRFDVHVARRGRAENVHAAAVIVAAPPRAAGALLSGLAPRLAEVLTEFQFAPVAVVGLGYRREQLSQPCEGFGFLVPRSEGLRILGTVWNSSLFAGRAPEGMVNFTSFVGGATDSEICQWEERRIRETVERELASVLGIRGAAVVQLVHRHQRALPQYNLGHELRIAAVRELSAGVPGLFLAGNYFEGPSLGACVEQAFRVAEAVRQYLRAIGEVAAAG